MEIVKIGPELMELYPNAEIKEAREIDPSWVGIAITIDWLIIVIDVNRTIDLKVMGDDYPYEYDGYSFTYAMDAIEFIKERVRALIGI